jgi:hypothetical protein
MVKDCAHIKTHTTMTELNHFTDSGGYMVEISLKCGECGQPFRFLGLPLGLNMNGATMSMDGLTARIAILPANRSFHPLEGATGFGVKPS